MKNLFLSGGLGFMSILTILLIIMCAWILYHFFLFISSKQLNKEKTLRLLKYGKSIGLFAMITGILGQLIGFYNMFSVIEKISDIVPALIFNAIKVTMISTLYGILIYLFSIILWFITSLIIEKKIK